MFGYFISNIIVPRLFVKAISCSKTIPENNTGSDFCIKSLIEQIDYVKEENNIKRYIIQSLLYQNPSSAANSQLKTNNHNNSSSFSYFVDVVYPNMNNINKNDGLITNDSINNNSENSSDDNNNHSDNDNDDNNNDKKRSVILTLSLK